MGKGSSNFLKGATILTAAGILSRLLGVFYKVPLYALVGSYGNGLISNATSIYTVLLMVSTVGLPAAISKMVSENLAVKDYRGVQAVFKVSSVLLLVVGGAASLFLFFGADWLIAMAKWEGETYSAIIAISPLPFIVSVCAAFRGYFQGFQIMMPTALSQIVEQIVRVILGTVLCWFFMTRGYGVGIASGGAVLGSTIGALFAAAILVFCYSTFRSSILGKLSRHTSKVANTTKAILKRLILIAIPVTLTSAIVAVFSLIDSLIYVNRLAAAGINDAITATTMWGDLANADTLINIPLVISGNLAVALIPAISESFALRDRRGVQEKIDIAIRVVMLVALPCCFGLSALSESVFDMLFPESPFGASILSTYALATIFMMFSNTFQSVLQSIDRFRIPLFNLGLAVIIRFVTSYFFMGIPIFNIYGIVVSNFITFAFLTFSNYFFVKRFTKVSINMKQTVVKPLVSSVVMALAVIGVDTLLGFAMGEFVHSRFGALIVVLIGLVIGVLTYGICMVIIGGLRPEEISFLPFSSKIFVFYRRICRLFGIGRREERYEAHLRAENRENDTLNEITPEDSVEEESEK